MSALAVLDTSIFVAQEVGRPLGRPAPEQAAVSVVTIAELELGVLVAADAETRARRLATLTRVRESVSGLPVDDRVASAYARLVATAHASGLRPRANDTWIAATALVHGAAVWTQDAGFTAFSDAVEVVRV